MKSAFEFLALCSCGLFAGAALYISLVEHPVRMSCGTDVAVNEFRPQLQTRDCHASIFGRRFLSHGDCSMAGRSRLELAYRRSANRSRHTVYADCHFADE